MATRASISIIYPTNVIKSVYCHFDGYVRDGVGQTLSEHYNTLEMVEKLISMGSISSLCEMFEPIGEVGMVRDYSTPEWKLIETTKPHSLYNRWEGVSTFYHRDGGQPLEITTRAHYLPLAMICEYNYLFNVETNEWSVAIGHDYRNKTRHWSELKWAPLSECLTPNKIN